MDPIRRVIHSVIRSVKAPSRAVTKTVTHIAATKAVTHVLHSGSIRLDMRYGQNARLRDSRSGCGNQYKRQSQEAQT